MPKRIRERIIIDSNGCWNWTKGKHPYGYGKYIYTQNGKKFHMSAHRLSWLVFKGEIPNGMRICHNCPNGDNPSCCNPDHLFLGTAKDNTHDMIKKKGFPDFRGEKNSQAILTEKQVVKMRELNNLGIKVSDIARKFNLKYYTCLDAVRMKNWKHI